MNRIIKNLHKENWTEIEKLIRKNKIDWDILVDQTNSLLHYLAYHGKTDLIKIIDTDVMLKIINIPNTEGDTICHIAAKLNDIGLLGVAISYNPEIIYLKNKLSCTPFHYLVSNEKLIRQIVKQINVRDHYLNNEYTLLEYYILDKNINMVKFLLKNIRTNNLTNICMSTIIQSENSIGSKLKFLEIFANKGFDINSPNQQFLSPLILAVYRQEYPIVKYLLEMGANPNYFGPENKDNSLTIAIIQANVPIIKLLLDYGIRIDICDKYLKTPLHYLFMEKRNIPDDVKYLLLDKIKNINLVDKNMDSILNLLLHNDNWKTYQDILKKLKLKIYLRNLDNISPIDAIKSTDLDDFYQIVYQSYLNQLDPDIQWVDDIDQKISTALGNGENIEEYYTPIMEKIIRGQSYPLKKNKNMIKLIVPPETNITHFAAYSYNYICFLYYILHKYPNIKIPSIIPEQNKPIKDLYREMVKNYQEDTPDNKIFRILIRDYINHSPVLINHIIIWKNDKKYFISPYLIRGIDKIIEKYPNTKFILLKLTIISNTNFNHANILIYDIENNYLERFDPYGNVFFYDSKPIDKMFKTLFSGSKYLSPNQSSDGISFQIFSDERNNNTYVENDPIGFCIAWCLWYVEMRAKNPKITPKSLIKRTIYQINKNQWKFKDYIRNYSNYLDTQKNNILENASVPNKYWYAMHIPIKFYRSYIKYVRGIYRKIV